MVKLQQAPPVDSKKKKTKTTTTLSKQKQQQQQQQQSTTTQQVKKQTSLLSFWGLPSRTKTEAVCNNNNSSNNNNNNNNNTTDIELARPIVNKVTSKKKKTHPQVVDNNNAQLVGDKDDGVVKRNLYKFFISESKDHVDQQGTPPTPTSHKITSTPTENMISCIDTMRTVSPPKGSQMLSVEGEDNNNNKNNNNVTSIHPVTSQNASTIVVGTNQTSDPSSFMEQDDDDDTCNDDEKSDNEQQDVTQPSPDSLSGVIEDDMKGTNNSIHNIDYAITTTTTTSTVVVVDDDDEMMNDPHLSDYEKLRLRNIQRNNARLAALGLIVPNARHQHNGQYSKSTARMAKNNKRRSKVGSTAVAATQAMPTRRSTRNRTRMSDPSNTEKVIDDTDDGHSSGNTKRMKTDDLTGREEEVYIVSPLVQYEVTTSSKHRDSVDDDVPKNDCTNQKCLVAKQIQTEEMTVPSTLIPIGPRFIPPKGLSAIYSLDFWDNRREQQQQQQQQQQLQCGRTNGQWLLGAGKAGMIALWNTDRYVGVDGVQYNDSDGDVAIHDNNQGQDPVLAWKGHNGRWIADARFLTGPSQDSNNSSNNTSIGTAPSRLVSAANDGTVCLWDLTVVSAQMGTPKLLHQTGKGLHTSGIFTMDVMAGSSSSILCTGSKDKTIAISSIESLTRTDLGGGPVWKSHYHNAKVGCVKLKGPTSNVLASAADDGLVAIHDYRMDGMKQASDSSIVANIKAHERPHTVLWDPNRESVLITAGLDPIIKIWDMRNMSTPLESFQGHVPASMTRCKKIHRPAIWSFPSANPKQSFLLTGGEGSGSISTFQLYAGESNNNVPSVPSLFSRGRMPPNCGDVGCISIDADSLRVAVAVEDGEILILEPR